ncbi:MAG: hypothetical protein EOP05_05775 [Proteobacteria bacterium]|nr:MAG: hypothetical protein EOP05_05775 [Pseudomonadota bacterium]
MTEYSIRKSMAAKFLATALLLLPLSSQAFLGIADALMLSQVVAPRKLHLCYISMNNDKEFGMTKDFVDRVQKLTGKNMIDVTEHQKLGESPESTLKTLMSSGTSCDGLVISGHHTGAFGGGRASGSLSIEFMERNACDHSTEAWYTKINSLWLQGCRTLGAPGELAGGDVNLADFHANRVGAVAQIDGLEQNQTQLAREFSDLLDLQTPYATRFMKTFPQARLYGWTQTAPGENAQSQKSLPFHIHNVAIRMMTPSQRKVLSSPFASDMSKAQAAIYQDALVGLLLPPKSVAALEASLTAWNDHGSPNASIGTIGFSNSDLAAMPPLYQNADLGLRQSRKLECDVRNAKTKPEMISALDQILSDQRRIALSFFTLQDVATGRNYGGVQVDTDVVIEKMRGNRNLMTFLEDKIKNPNASLIRKIETAGFLTRLGESPTESTIINLKEQVEAHLLKPMASTSDYSARDYKLQLLSASMNQKLIRAGDLAKLLDRAPDNTIPKGILSGLSGDNTLGRRQIAELIQSVHASKFGSEVSSELVQAIVAVPVSSPELTSILKSALVASGSNAKFYLSSAFNNKNVGSEVFEIAKTQILSEIANKAANSVYQLMAFARHKRTSATERIEALSAAITALEATNPANRLSELNVLLWNSGDSEKPETMPALLRARYIKLLTEAEASILGENQSGNKAPLIIAYSKFPELRPRAKQIIEGLLATSSARGNSEILEQIGYSLFFSDFKPSELSFVPRSYGSWLIKNSATEGGSYLVFKYLNASKASAEQFNAAIKYMDARTPINDDQIIQRLVAYAETTALSIEVRRTAIDALMQKLVNLEFKAALPLYVETKTPGIFPDAVARIKAYLAKNPSNKPRAEAASRAISFRKFEKR